MSLKTIIVDDEPPAREIIETYCQSLFPELLKIEAVCPNALEANKVLKAKEIDLMFLDINMPELTGLDFLSILDDPPLTILTTAHPDYALQSYELDVVDYLLKPIPKKRFVQAVEKANELFQYKKVEQFSEDAEENDFIFIKSDKKYIKIRYNEIIYVEGLKDYVLIYTDKQKIIALHTMKSLEAKLEDHGFRRIHRSYIANLKRVASIAGNELNMNIKNERVSIPIGKSYREEIHAWIDAKKL